jgi:cellulose synthase/poly-beta-1,6-N-acetylglucosamine synthase-like glycosyltransferase
MVAFLEATQWFFLGYFIALQLGYLVLNLMSLGVLRAYMENTSVDRISQVFSGLEPPVSIVASAYNEAATIVGSVRSLLQLNYPEFEVVVCNDGSTDDTLEILRREFQLVEYPETRTPAIGTRPVRAYYRSKTRPNLRVIDKENGGRADGLNASINIAQYPLVCAIDADSILQRDSLYLVVQPFVTDPQVVAAGGTIRVANGCQVRDGFLVGIGLPRNWVALFQIVEYLRAFLFGRVGWNRMNALLIISGAFGVFRRDVVTAAGGYHPGTLGEDMELTVRLHRQLRAKGKPYRITFVPDPVCWTEVPQDLRTLGRQRARWHRGLSESLWWNRELFTGGRGGMAGWVAYPYAVLFEWFAPILELAGYGFMLVAWALGVISPLAFLAFLLAAIGMGVLVSVTALLLEEMSFHLYPRLRQFWTLLAVAVLENFGFRQLNTIWRLRGLLQWLFRRKAVWGAHKRSGAWQNSG